MSWKKMIMGEKMPDKDDPKYRDRYEREVDAGRKFARATKIDKAAAKVQQYANDHKKLFLAIVFGFIILSFTGNLIRMGKVYNAHQSQKSATEVQEELVRNRHKRVKHAISSVHTMPVSVNKEFKESQTKINKDNGHSEED